MPRGEIRAGTPVETQRWIVHGRVQGVGFRYHVLRAASALGLAGDVRNLPDGSVEIRVRGAAGPLARLLESVREGPPGARVRAVETHPVEAHVHFDVFTIR